MKNIIIAFLMLALVGCSQQANVDVLGKSSNISDFVAALKTITVTDLDAATARAVAGNDPIAAACYPVLKKYVQQGLPGLDKVAGAFDAFEQSRTVGNKVLQGIPVDLRMGCAPLLQDERDFIARLAAIARGGSIGG